MSFLNVFLTGFALSMDAFAVSITKGMSLKHINPKLAFKIAFFFGFFQGFMPLIGWFLGIRFESYIKSIDHWIALFLLSFIGIKMIFEALDKKDDTKKIDSDVLAIDNRELIILSIATSIDALAVGVSFAFLSISILPICISISVITFTMCFLGVVIGKRLGDLFKNHAQILGGVILIFIGLNILNEHTDFISKIFNL